MRLIGGPYNGRMVSDTSDTLILTFPLNQSFNILEDHEPVAFAFAYYMVNAASAYAMFRGVIRTDKVPITVTFRGTDFPPLILESLVPIVLAPERYLMALDEHKKQTGLFGYFQVAEFIRNTESPIDGFYQLISMSRSGPVFDVMKKQLEYEAAKQSLRKYYLQLDHLQFEHNQTQVQEAVFIQSGSRKAIAVKVVAAVIVQLWRLGLDVSGASSDSGKAMILFELPIPGESKALYDCLAAQFDHLEMISKSFTYSTNEGAQLELEGGYIRFPVERLHDVTNFLESVTPEQIPSPLYGSRLVKTYQRQTGELLGKAIGSVESALIFGV